MAKQTDTFGIGVATHLGRSGDILWPVKAVLAYLVVRPATAGLPLSYCHLGHHRPGNFWGLRFAETHHHLVWTLHSLMGIVPVVVQQ